MDENTKPAHTSKSIIFGALVFLMGLAPLVLEFWTLLTPEQSAQIEAWLGPEMFAVVGLVVVILRAITNTGVRFRGRP